jgi:hypothetical protein
MKVSQIAKILALLMLLTIAALPSFKASAATPTEPHAANAMWIEPSLTQLNVTLIPAGYEFNVTVWANCSVSCGGWQAWILYEKAYVNATRAGYTGPDGFKSDFFQNITTIAVSPSFKSHNGTHNRVEYGESWAGSGPYRSPGYGSLCWIEFNVTSLPSSPQNTTLSFYAYTGSVRRTYLVNGADSSKVDLNAYDGLVKFLAEAPPVPRYTLTITATTGGTTNPTPGIRSYDEGTVVTVQALPNSGFQLDNWELDTINIGATNPVNVTMDTNHTLNAVFSHLPPPSGTRIFVDPPEIIDPTMVPSSEFHINITVDDVQDLKTCIFNMSYDPGVIGWIAMRLYKIQGMYPTPIVDADDQAGWIWMKLMYPAGFTSMDPLALVRLDFHVDALGATVLDLHDTHLLDSTGAEMPHNETDGFFMSLIRDIAITNVAPNRSWAYAGWPVNVTVTVKNKGNISETFDVRAYYDTDLMGTMTVTNLLPDEVRDVVFQWDTTGVGDGNYTIKAEADILPYEINTADNSFTDGVVWIMTEVRDVAITNLTISNSWAYKGWIVNVTVTVKNKGSITETFTTQVYYNSNLLANLTVANLLPTEERSILIPWNSANVTACTNHTYITYTISANIPPIPYEFNTTDNQMTDGTITFRIVGDVNGDCEVAIDDVYATAQAFGSYPGHPRWNVYADVNNDEYVGIDDIYTVATHFGETCPP